MFLQDWYSQSFRDLMEFDELNELDDQTLSKFCQTLKTIQTRHTNVVQTMAQGVLELKDSHQVHTKLLNPFPLFLFFHPCTFIRFILQTKVKSLLRWKTVYLFFASINLKSAKNLKIHMMIGDPKI